MTEEHKATKTEINLAIGIFLFTIIVVTAWLGYKPASKGPLDITNTQGPYIALLGDKRTNKHYPVWDLIDSGSRQPVGLGVCPLGQDCSNGTGFILIQPLEIQR